jgi:ammonia channel protein AmtB
MSVEKRSSLDDALKTFLIWKGIGHVVMLGYAILVAWLLVKGFNLGDKLSTQQAAIIATATTMLPMMLNFYSGVMAATEREKKDA